MGAKWVAVLGGGKEQVPLIEAVQAEGYRAVAFDRDRDACGKDIAERFLPVSNRDVPALLAALRPFQPELAGIITAASEITDVVSWVAFHLGLPGLPPLVGEALRDKSTYKRILERAGVRSARHFVTGRASLFEHAYQLRGDVVLKPGRGSGSRGVSLVTDRRGLEAAFVEAVSHGSGVLIEEYLEGPQVSSETVLWDGRAEMVAFADRVYDLSATAPHFVELGGSTPTAHPEAVAPTLALIQEAARALGIRRGTVKGDLVLTEDGPALIELTARLSGGPFLAMTQKSTGVNYFRAAVRIACGYEPDWNALRPKRCEPVTMDMQGNVVASREALRAAAMASAKAPA